MYVQFFPCCCQSESSEVREGSIAYSLDHSSSGTAKRSSIALYLW